MPADFPVSERGGAGVVIDVDVGREEEKEMEPELKVGCCEVDSCFTVDVEVDEVLGVGLDALMFAAR